MAFSPRMRGCSYEGLRIDDPEAVFPAYAGMFRVSSMMWGTCRSFPRVCGDVPGDARLHDVDLEFSPRMRGCSETTCFNCFSLAVFPAYAGMFRDNLF